MMKKFCTLLFCLTLPLLAQAASDQLQVSNAWIKQLPPVVPVRAGYLVLTNTGDQPLRLVAVSGADFDRVELHETLMADGTMKMVQREAFDIPPRGKLVLQPGGKHLMLFDPVRPLNAGDRSPLELEFDDGGRISVDFEIRP